MSQSGSGAFRVIAVVCSIVICSSLGVSSCSSIRETDPAAKFAAPIPIDLPVPSGSREAAVASLAYSGSAWFAAGSFRDAADQHHPGLWASTDAVHWTQVMTVPVTYYGQISELYSVAASVRGVVALGAATGGAHGNPRTVSWILRQDGRLHEVVAGFELYNGVRQISVRSVAEGPRGWVIIGSRVDQNGRIGAASWTSPTGDDFTIHDDDATLSSATTEQIFGLDVAPIGDGVVAVGELTTFGATAGETDGIAWTSSDGAKWTRWTPAGLQLGGSGVQRPQRVASRGRRILIAGTQSDGKRTSITAWSTIDGTTWSRTTVEPFGTSDDVLSAATAATVTSNGFVVAARQGGILRLATSVDGRTWTELPVGSGLPTGNRAGLTVQSNGDTLLIGVTSLSGGGLWRTTASQ